MRNSRRKNFLPTFILTIIFWGLLVWLIFSFPPTNNYLLLSFFSLLFLAVFLTSALIFANSKLGLLTAFLVILFFAFRYYQIGNYLNVLLLTGVFISLGFYLR